MPGNIYYRGDDREPGQIFKNGFQKRALTSNITYRPFVGKAGDIDPDSAVCVTRWFETAPLFPFSNENPRYIYALYLDDSVVFDTRERQIQETGAEIQKLMLSGVAHKDVKALDIGWPLYAHEYATDAVPSKDIIGAVRCQILSRFGDGWRVTYVCSSPMSSHYCTLPIGVRIEGLEKLAAAAEAGGKTSPHPSWGFGGLTIY